MRAAVLVGLVLLTGAALVVRLTNLDFGLPQAHELDLHPYLLSLEWLRTGAPADPAAEAHQMYPLLVPYLADLLPAVPPAAAGSSLFEHLAAASAALVQLRGTVAVLSALVVPATWLLARRFLTPGWALLAAALAGSSLLSLVFSQQARPHAITATTYTLAVLGAMAARRRGDLCGWVFAGAGAALAIGTLQSGVAVLFSLAAAWLLRARSGGRWLDPLGAIPLLLVAGGALWFYPFSTLGGMSEQAGSTFVLSGHLLILDDFRGHGFVVLLRTLSWYDPALLATALVGLVAAGIALARGVRPRSRLERDELWIALAFALPYVLVIGLYDRTYERFASPLLPFLSLLGAWGLSVSTRWVGARSHPGAARIVGPILALAALALPTYAAIRLAQVRGAPHTTELAARWIEEHVPAGSARIGLTPNLDLPLVRQAEDLVFQRRSTRERYDLIWSRYQALVGVDAIDAPRYDLGWPGAQEAKAVQRLMEDPQGLLRSAGADLFVLEVFGPDRPPFTAAAMRGRLVEGARRLARFTPDSRDDYSEHPFDYQDPTVRPHPPAFLPRLLQARRTGPVIEIYALGEEPSAGQR